MAPLLTLQAYSHSHNNTAIKVVPKKSSIAKDGVSPRHFEAFESLNSVKHYYLFRPLILNLG